MAKDCCIKKRKGNKWHVPQFSSFRGFRTEIQYFCTAEIGRLNLPNSILGRDVFVAGIVTDVEHKISKVGKGYGYFRVEDFKGDYQFRVFGNDYLKFKHFFENEQLLFIKARAKNTIRDKVKKY